VKHLLFVLTRLWRYHSLYFLKPFDAVNDTLTASLLARLDWAGEFVEVGSGDGVYSYVMHGGTFPLWFDRYLITDLGRQDIFDTHHRDVIPSSQPLHFPDISLAFDAKPSHVAKVAEIGFVRQSVCALSEHLPLATASVANVFLYTPHGLRSHEAAILEASRILKPGGRLLILVYDTAFRDAFICARLSRYFGGRLGRYFAALDNGRYDEITRMARHPEQWTSDFSRYGFEVDRCHAGLSTFAWMVYDTQTRPLLKPLIRLFNLMPMPLRTLVKMAWMFVWFPILILFYALFSNDVLNMGGGNCYMAYGLSRVSQPTAQS
jgi:SAM-dependent methyltransferase